ncbi:hypothetical protein KEM55_009290 [Ascosphaera atra]|nr:hypothetical protein KEM55_009290 [Ascosphaera atra]
MVQLTEVEDEHFSQQPQAEKGADSLLVSDNEDDDDYTDTESEISTDSYDAPPEESLYERITALKDIVPPHYRRTLSTAASYISSGVQKSVNFGGNALWILSTTAFFVGVPWAMALAEEQQFAQLEKEQGMIKGANEMLTPGATSMLTEPQGQQENKEENKAAV